MTQDENESIKQTLEINFNSIRTFAEKISQRYQQIKSIYLFGSVARGDADERSDIDLFLLVKGKSSEFFVLLSKDEDYRVFEDWALGKVEGGINPFICNEEELKDDFDTLIKKILNEGIRLYGQDLKEIKGLIRDKKNGNSLTLLELVRSL
ncbi:MAG: nucleotidyltransferase family protein [Promethearchaeota archaeon]